MLEVKGKIEREDAMEIGSLKDNLEEEHELRVSLEEQLGCVWWVGPPQIFTPHTTFGCLLGRVLVQRPAELIRKSPSALPTSEARIGLRCSSWASSPRKQTPAASEKISARPALEG